MQTRRSFAMIATPDIGGRDREEATACPATARGTAIPLGKTDKKHHIHNIYQAIAGGGRRPECSKATCATLPVLARRHIDQSSKFTIQTTVAVPWW